MKSLGYDQPKEFSHAGQHGLLVTGLMWGIAASCGAIDWLSRSEGYVWGYSHLGPRFTEGVLIAGPILGLVIGYAVDAFVTSSRIRGLLLKTAWCLLGITATVYFLLIVPALGIRE